MFTKTKPDKLPYVQLYACSTYSGFPIPYSERNDIQYDSTILVLVLYNVQSTVPGTSQLCVSVVFYVLEVSTCTRYNKYTQGAFTQPRCTSTVGVILLCRRTCTLVPAILHFDKNYCTYCTGTTLERVESESESKSTVQYQYLYKYSTSTGYCTLKTLCCQGYTSIVPYISY